MLKGFKMKLYEGMAEEYERRHQMRTVSNTQLPTHVIKIELNPDGSVKRITKK